MPSRVVLLTVLTLYCFQSLSFAEAKPSIEDKMIAGTLRTMAKAYIATADIEKLKRNNIEKINRMSGERFRKRYAEAYPTFQCLPPKLKTRYGITETVTKNHAVRTLISLDKKKLYELIDALPDTVIAKQFRQYWDKKGADPSARSVAERINTFWNSIVGKITKPPIAVENKQ